MIILENSKNDNIILSGYKCSEEFIEKIKINKKWDGDINVYFVDKKKEIKYLYRDNCFYLISSKLRHDQNFRYDFSENLYEDEFYECCDF
jgi:hypothetical protein